MRLLLRHGNSHRIRGDDITPAGVLRIDRRGTCGSRRLHAHRILAVFDAYEARVIGLPSHTRRDWNGLTAGIRRCRKTGGSG